VFADELLLAQDHALARLTGAGAVDVAAQRSAST
jgi:hypothetical protein